MNVGSRVMKDGSVELEIRAEPNRTTTGAHLKFILGPDEWEKFVRYIVTVTPAVYNDPNHPSASIIPGGLRPPAEVVMVAKEVFIDEAGATEIEIPFRHNLTEGYGDDGHLA